MSSTTTNHEGVQWHRHRRSAALALFIGLGCGSAESSPAPAPREAERACDATAPTRFDRSPGGVPEADPHLVHARRCGLRIVDIRTEAELHGPLGVIPGAEAISEAHLLALAGDWPRDEPVVLVCRSGRRSGALAQELSDLGFSRVASMTGGMLAWRAAGLETATADSLAPSPHPPPARRSTALSEDVVAAHVADHDRVRWVKAATLMLHGTSACVDGRDSHAIVGTPGGDAGELVLVLAAAEAMTGTALSDAEVERIFDAYLEAFGHFYLHTDVEAAARLHQGLRDAGLTSLPPLDPDSRWLSAPPPGLREAILERVADPDYVGCGHLRLMLERPDEYSVRPGLVRTVLRAFLHRLWTDPALLEFRVLEGQHAESAVISVELGHDLHPYSPIPLVSPRIGDNEVFVDHPQVAHFVREQNAAFLLEASPALASAGLQEESFLAEVERLANQQLGATLHHLASDLPVFVVRFEGRSFEVSRAAAAGENEAGVPKG